MVELLILLLASGHARFKNENAATDVSKMTPTEAVSVLRDELNEFDFKDIPDENA
jgi:hypothetical protein